MSHLGDILIIAIDSRALMNPPAGVGNFLIAAVNYWSTIRPSWQFYLLVNRDIHISCSEKLLKNSNIQIMKKPFCICPNIGLLWFICKLFFVLKKIKPDFFWAPSGILPPMIPSSVKILLTVHDLVPVKYRHTMMKADKYYYRLYFKKSICRADILWAVSYYTREQIKKMYPSRKSKTILVGQCFEKKRFHPVSVAPETRNSIQQQYGLNEKFLLYVGTIEPRKNLRFLISLMPELVKHGFSLLIVGAKGWGKAGIHDKLQSDKKVNDRIAFSGFITDSELITIYNHACLLAIPSINEGFGLPALEAMLCRCPVVAADHSGLHEVVKDGGMLIRGWDKKKWIQGIMEVSQNREKYIQKGMLKSLYYDPAETIQTVSKAVELEKYRCVQ